MTTGGRSGGEQGAARPLEELLLGFGALATLLFAVPQAAWALNGGGSFSEPETAQRVMLLAGAVLAATAAFALWHLVGGRLRRAVLALAWAGSAVAFASALTETLKVVAIPQGKWGAVATSPGDATLTLFVLLGVLGGAVGGALRLVEEERGLPAPMPHKGSTAVAVGTDLGH